MHQQQSISLKFLLIIFGCVFLPLIGFGILKTLREISAKKEHSQFKINQFLEIAAQGSALAIWDVNPTGAQELLNAIAQDEMIEKLELYDEAGIRLITSRKIGHSSDHFVGYDSDEIHAKDIFFEGKKIGHVKLYFSRNTEMLMIYSQMPLFFLAFVGLSIFSCSFAYFFFYQSIFLKINRLAHDAQLLASGQLGSSFIWQVGGDEIDEVGCTLENARYEIKSNISELENKVKEHSATVVHSARLASIGEMASGIAHEINNPLAALLGKIEVIKLKQQMGKIEWGDVLNELETIKLLGARIGKIVRGLLTFSHKNNSEPLANISLESSIQVTLQLCQERLKMEGIELRLPIETIEQHLVHAHSLQLSQVLLNLVMNAADAISNLEHKWIEIKFDDNCSRLGKAPLEKHRLIIQDSGAGIPAERREKIFLPFFTTKETNKGTGLGLSISSNIIKSFGGSLYLDPNQLHTTFVVELPAVIQNEATQKKVS